MFLNVYKNHYFCVQIFFMRTISVSEFRSNIKRYLDIAKEEKLIIHRGKGGSFVVIPVEEMEDEPYSAEFVNRILEKSK